MNKYIEKNELETDLELLPEYQTNVNETKLYIAKRCALFILLILLRLTYSQRLIIRNTLLNIEHNRLRKIKQNRDLVSLKGLGGRRQFVDYTNEYSKAPL